MLENYITQLEIFPLNTEKIKAITIPIKGLPAYVYIDYQKQLHFIVKSEEKIIENRKGIKVTNRTLDLVDFGKNEFIDFVCTHKDFKTEFIQIIEEIIDHYKENQDLTKAIKIIINKWYYFFEKENSNELTEGEIKGLIGELIFIKNHNRLFGESEILKAWKGPESGLRDFNFPELDVEVKTSSKEIGHIHTINGQFQLKSDKIPLYVYSINLKRSDSANSFTLNSLISEVCIQFGANSMLLNDFFEKLERMNVLVSGSQKFNAYSYELKDILTVKITNQNLSNFIVFNQNTRISNMKYDYDFNGLENIEILK